MICPETTITSAWTHCLRDVGSALLDAAPLHSVESASPSLMTSGGLGLKEGNINNESFQGRREEEWKMQILSHDRQLVDMY